MGADAYLCCPGPSLDVVDTSLLCGPGIFVTALNTAYPRVLPHLWIGMDQPDCYPRGVWWGGFLKIGRSHRHECQTGGLSVKCAPNTYWADVSPPEGACDIFDRRAHDVEFIWHYDTLRTALHALVWMGAHRIHFVGCDLGGKKDYYDDRVLTPEQRVHNRTLYDRQGTWLKWFAEEGRRRGLELISCTPNSPINQWMPFKTLRVATDDSSARVPSGGPILHCKPNLGASSSSGIPERRSGLPAAQAGGSNDPPPVDRPASAHGVGIRTVRARNADR